MRTDVIVLGGVGVVAFMLLRRPSIPVSASAGGGTTQTQPTQQSTLQQLLAALQPKPASPTSPTAPKAGNTGGGGSGMSMGSGSGSSGGGSPKPPANASADPFDIFAGAWQVQSSAGDYVDNNGNLRDSAGNLVGITPTPEENWTAQDLWGWNYDPSQSADQSSNAGVSLSDIFANSGSPSIAPYNPSSDSGSSDPGFYQDWQDWMAIAEQIDETQYGGGPGVDSEYSQFGQFNFESEYV